MPHGGVGTLRQSTGRDPLAQRATPPQPISMNPTQREAQGLPVPHSSEASAIRLPIPRIKPAVSRAFPPGYLRDQIPLARFGELQHIDAQNRGNPATFVLDQWKHLWQMLSLSRVWLG